MLSQIHIEVRRPPGLGAVVAQRAGPSGRCDKIEHFAGRAMDSMTNDESTCSRLSTQIAGIFVNLPSRCFEHQPDGGDSSDRLTHGGEDKLRSVAVEGAEKIVHQTGRAAIPAGGHPGGAEPETGTLQVEARATHDLRWGNRRTAEFEGLAQ